MNALDEARPVRWGILGAGKIARTVGEDIRDTNGNTVWMVGARDRDRAAALARHLGAPYVGSYRDVVSDDAVDVVYVATTTAQHYEHALLALHAGKPVLVEKPFTVNGQQARDVITTARQNKLFCMEAMWTRLNPLVRAAHRLIAQGRIGTVRSMRADLSIKIPFDPNRRHFSRGAGGGALLDLGVYCVTLTHLLLGRPDKICVNAQTASTGVDTQVRMGFAYRDGRTANLSCGFTTQQGGLARIVGTAGKMTLGPRLHHPELLILQTPGVTKTASDSPPGNRHRAVVAEVERCLRASLLQSPRVSLRSTLDVMDILDATRRRIGVTYPDEHASGSSASSRAPVTGRMS